MFLLRVIIVTALCVLPTHGARCERDEVGDDSEVGELLDLDEEERVERDDGEDGEDSVYVSSLELEEHCVEIIPGKKEGTIWLIVDSNYICVKNDESESGSVFWWECRYRRNTGCPFKMTTRALDEDEHGVVDRNGKHSILVMMEPKTHCCGQNEVDILNEKFKLLIKEKMKDSIKANFQTTYDTSRITFAQNIPDPHRREEFLQTCPTANSYRSSANRARTKRIPVAPKSYHDVNFGLIGGNTDYTEFILAQVFFYLQLVKFLIYFSLA